MPCPNDARRRSVTVAFRVTPDQAEWLDDVAKMSGMTKQDFIMTRLQDEAITVSPNPRVQKALVEQMERLYIELVRLTNASQADERIIESIERLIRVFQELGAAKPTVAASADDDDLFSMER